MENSSFETNIADTEVKNFAMSVLSESNISDDQFDTQAVAYFCQFCIKKLN